MSPTSNFIFTNGDETKTFEDTFVPKNIFDEGNGFTWGSNSQANLGNNFATGSASLPVSTFRTFSNWKEVSSGYLTVGALDNLGDIWIWGLNNYGQGGQAAPAGFHNPLTVPMPVQGVSGWKTFSIGVFHVTGITYDGSLYAWGDNSLAQVTNVIPFSGASNYTIPIKITSGTWKSVSTKGNFSAAIRSDNTLWLWGRNNSGQLGIDNNVTGSTPVTTFAGGNNWKQVSCGTQFTAAIKTDGSLWLWGDNSSGQLGIGDTVTRYTPVTTFSGGYDWREVASGNGHVVAIKNNGSLWVWGNNYYGQLGTFDIVNRSTPTTTFFGGRFWRKVSASNVTLASSTDGILWSWGSNSNGLLGVNISPATVAKASTPVTLASTSGNWISFAAGDTTAVAIRENRIYDRYVNQSGVTDVSDYT